MATLLYIDQDEASQQLIQATLGQHYNIITVSDGPTAIQYCAIMQPDLVFMNLTLPTINGYELASRIKTFIPEIPILIVTDRDFDGLEAQALAAHFDGLISKPFAAEELRQIVQSLLPFPVQLPDRQEDKVVDQLEAQIATLNQTNQRLASINAISALIGTSLDLEHLTDEILGQLQKIIAFDSATLFLLKGEILEAAASRGFAEYRRGMNTYPKNMHNSAWQVAENRLPLIINDVTKSNIWETRPELKKIRSWLGVPLIYKNRVVGVLTLDKNEPNAFTQADARYVFTLAYQIAITVENAQLFEEWEKQSSRLKLINEIGREINTLLDINNMFDVLARAMCERLDYERVAILEVDPARSYLILRAVYGSAPARLKPDVYQQEISAGFIGQAVQMARTVFLNSPDPADSLLATGEAQVRTELIVPIVVGNQVEGVIDVDRAYPPGLGDLDLWTLSNLASQAATCIENARLYRQVQAYSGRLERAVVARTQRLQAIKKISQVVSQGIPMNELLAVVGRDIGQIFAPDTLTSMWVVIGLTDGADVLLKTIYATTPAAAAPGQVDHVLRLKIEAHLPLSRVINLAEPVILHNFYLSASHAEANPPEVDQPKPSNSVMIAPLITGGKTIGLIKIEGDAADLFDEGDLETLELLAFQVASAIEHARLLQRTREIAIVEERTRLARDMHDGIAQNLAYLLLQVDRSLNMVGTDSKLETQLERVHTLLKQNIDELRRNIFELRPVELEGKSLFAALKNSVTEFGRRWHLKTSCVLKGEPPEDMSPEVESTLYRILQETLSNAQQHADCRQLAVSLAVEDDHWVTLEVQDNGTGFNVTKIDQSIGQRQGKGLGLVSMRERVHTVGGQLTITSAPGEGTCVFVKLPLKHEFEKHPN